MFSAIAEHQSLETIAADPVWKGLGDSLRNAVPEAIDSPAARIGVLGLALLVAGCSPQQKSFWGGSFTAVPAPPPEARMQLGTSTETDGNLFINYVVWDASKARFERKDIQYSTENIIGLNNSKFSQLGGHIQHIADGEVLYGGAIVDQAAHKIILSNGNYIDGPTGNVHTANGELLKALVPAKE